MDIMRDVMSTEKKVTTSTTLDPEDLKTLEKIRKETGEKSISAVIRKAVKFYIESLKETSPGSR